MVRNFYYRTEAEIVDGSANFASMITADAVSLGLTAAQATAFGTLNTALQSAWTEAVTPETRTPVSIEAKKQAIFNMRRSAVLLSKIIYATATVTDAQLIGLGLLPRTVPGPRPATMTAPEVDVVSVIGRFVKIRISQPGVESKARPVGSAGALVYSFVGPAAPSEPDAYKFEGLSTRRTVDVLFPNDVASGATAWIAAAWISQRGQRGFACTPVSVTIQGGPVLAEAA